MNADRHREITTAFLQNSPLGPSMRARDAHDPAFVLAPESKSVRLPFWQCGPPLHLCYRPTQECVDRILLENYWTSAAAAAIAAPFRPKKFTMPTTVAIADTETKAVSIGVE